MMSTTEKAAAISARIDRLPSSGPVWGWVIRLSFGAFFEIYELALTPLLVPMLVKVGIFHKDQNGLFGLSDLATFAFATFAGLFIGVLIFGAISDRFGRRSVFTWALLWYAAATLMMAAQTDALMICVWRLIAAIGVGAEVVAIDSYLSELMPKNIRGRGFAISKAIQYSAVPIAGALGALLTTTSVAGIAGWRLMLFVPVIGAILIWWVRRDLPESPRWLALNGRAVEAERIVTDVENAVTRDGRTLPTPATPVIHNVVPSAFTDLFRAPLRRRVLMMIIASCAGTVAFYGFTNWLPSLLEAKGVEITRSFAYSAMIYLAFPIAPFLFSFFADRFERKWQLVAGALIVAAAGLSFANQESVAGWIVCGLLVTIGNNLSAYATHTYRSELFPTGVRARAISVVYSLDRLAAALNGYLIAFILRDAGQAAVLVAVTAAALLCASTVAFFGPSTRSVASEDIHDNDLLGAATAELKTSSY